MGVVSLGWEALQWEGRELRPDQKMGQFQSQSAQRRLGSAMQWVALEPVLQVVLSFAFPFPRLPSGKPPRLPGSSGTQLPLYCPWPWESMSMSMGASPSSNTSGPWLPGGPLLSLGHLCRVLLPWESSCPKAWSPARGGRDSRVWDGVGRALSQIQELGSFPNSEGSWTNQISFCLSFLRC